MMENIIIRIICNACGTELEQKHANIDPLTGVTTIKVGECKPCMDEAFEDGIDGAYQLDDED